MVCRALGAAGIPTRTLGCVSDRYRDQTASEMTAQTSSTAAATNAGLKTKGRRATGVAPFHTRANRGAASLSAVLNSLNSAWSFFSLPDNSIFRFRSTQPFAQVFFATFIVLPRAAN